MKARYTSTKIFSNLPCAHRQWRHEDLNEKGEIITGRCALIHGYSRSFTFYFACNQLTNTFFVVDFGDLDGLSKWLKNMFDHTTLINEDDPQMEYFKEGQKKGIFDLRILPNVGMEATSKYVFDWADKFIREKTKGRAWLYKVETRENDKNSAFYELVDGQEVAYVNHN